MTNQEVMAEDDIVIHPMVEGIPAGCLEQRKGLELGTTSSVPIWKEDLVDIGVCRKAVVSPGHGFHSISKNWARVSTPSRQLTKKNKEKGGPGLTTTALVTVNLMLNDGATGIHSKTTRMSIPALPSLMVNAPEDRSSHERQGDA